MSLPDSRLQQLILNALEEDTGDGDHSSLACIPEGARGRAILHIKQKGILAGMAAAELVFRICDPGSTFISLKKDGEPMEPGQQAFEVEGTVRGILRAERVALNIMQRMSGIATLTRRYVDRISGYRSRILDTRKTTPNFRLLEKEAVRIGGGENHRMGLYDMIMLKDNHIDYAGGLEQAILRARKYVEEHRPGLAIEVELRSLAEVRQVLSIGQVDRIMLDNFSPGQLREAVQLIGGRFETEASGGIHLDNVEEYAATGVDFISIGALIHQAQSLDLSLKAAPAGQRSWDAAPE